MTSSSATSAGGPTLENPTLTQPSASINVSSQFQAQAGPRSSRLVEIGKDFELCCAHVLPNHLGKCSRLHGHNYKIEVYMEGNINLETGMVEDFDRLTTLVQYLIIDLFDHQNLNDFYELPTAENLAVSWMDLLWKADHRFCRIVVWETSKCRAIAYR